ncbi:unnamed protein product [Caenorhabditis angaria]|uniref:GH18 domain-containing protein n=1 Tax=Caenorhabditis angaria TaxID=860376 RepID=A0A9P1IS12_9PELO|nr:unnamed protein product [Caenorhabditis angaria]
MRTLILLAAWVLVVFGRAASPYGTAIDVSTPLDFITLQNLRLDMYTKIYVRAFDTNSASFDKSMVTTIKSAYVTRFSVELFMSPNLGSSVSPGDQVKSIATGVSENLIHADGLWIEVSQTASKWSADIAKNREFLHTLLNTANQLNFKKIGIFTSSDDWKMVTGNTLEFASMGLKLWYYSGDSNGNFDDFVAFGGWKAADVKQTVLNQNVDGAKVNLDYYKFSQ